MTLMNNNTSVRSAACVCGGVVGTFNALGNHNLCQVRVDRGRDLVNLDSLICRACNGSGTTMPDGFSGIDVSSAVLERFTCRACSGRGSAR